MDVSTAADIMRDKILSLEKENTELKKELSAWKREANKMKDELDTFKYEKKK